MGFCNIGHYYDPLLTKDVCISSVNDETYSSPRHPGAGVLDGEPELPASVADGVLPPAELPGAAGRGGA